MPIPATLSLLWSMAVIVHTASSASLYKGNATEPRADGFSSTNISETNTEKVANFAASQISSANLPEPVTLVNTIRADSYVSENYGVQVNLILELEGGGEEILLCEVLVFSDIVEPAQWTVDDLTLIGYACTPIKNVSAEVYEETSSPIPFSSIDVNDTKINDIADFATDVIVTNINAEPTMRLVEIIKAGWQSTATSIDYKLTLKLRGIDEKEDLLCEATVYIPTTQAATKTRELRQYNCSLSDVSSSEIDVDIPGDAVLSKWIFA